MEAIEVTLVFPAYNEVDGLEKAVTVATKELSKITSSYEIIVAEDGSNDGTDILANYLSLNLPYVKHLHSDERQGRGRALIHAFRESNGEILVYMDVDLSTETSFLKPLIDSIRKGWDLCTGSRMLPESVVTRSTTRGFSSKTYNTLIRFLFDTGLQDHQCGFKAFNRRSIFEVLEYVQDSHWFWDTEVLAVASHQGYRICEIPVNWFEDRSTTVNLLSDSMRMGFKAFSLWWRLRRLPKQKRGGPGRT